jgi:hypothetical protein
MDELIEEFTIAPAGRHILTIGEDLIQDHHAAIVELVKNAYDADSPDAQISFSVQDDEESIVIVITDHGHGMTRQTVVNSWLVPSTAFKLIKRVSPSGRIMQGRKGIGRYAASILGTHLILETVDKTGQKTSLTLKWEEFEAAVYLHDVKIPIKTVSTTEQSGTRLTISGGKQYLSFWSPKELEKLEHELKKMISPVEHAAAKNAGRINFEIKLELDGFLFDSNINRKKEIQPIPLFELFDYRISGRVEDSGRATLTYSTQKAKNTVTEEIQFELGEVTGCGNLFFDIRVYDREKEAIDQLIRRGLRNEKGAYFAMNEARNLLNEFNGIGVYRNGFRIRPLGDPDFDWLKLNEQRIQNPSVRIGSNQVIGYVEIESEETSNLQEKSARDGLKENKSYTRLREITGRVISKLEERRYIYRSKAGLSRSVVKVERELEKLFEFEEIKSTIRSRLQKGGVKNKIADDIVKLLTKKEEESNKIVEDIRNTVAVYQGQATLGKIINVIMHEGRKPLNYFKNQIPNLKFWSNEFRLDSSVDTLNEMLPLLAVLGKIPNRLFDFLHG